MERLELGGLSVTPCFKYPNWESLR